MLRGWDKPDIQQVSGKKIHTLGVRFNPKENIICKTWRLVDNIKTWREEKKSTREWT
jgi:hypothetical protein